MTIIFMDFLTVHYFRNEIIADRFKLSSLSGDEKQVELRRAVYSASTCVLAGLLIASSIYSARYSHVRFNIRNGMTAADLHYSK